MNGKIRLAMLMDGEMLRRAICPADMDFLRTFAEVLNADCPDKMSEEYMAGWLPWAQACFTCWGTPKFTKQLLDGAPDLRVILHGAGTPKAIVTDEVWERRIRVATAAPIIAKDVAETALGGIIYWLKQFKRFDAITRSGAWSKDGGRAAVDSVKPIMKRLEKGLTVGVLGASHVGRNMIKFLRPFGVNVLLYDPYVSPNEAEILGVTLSCLDNIAEKSDVITVHLPSIPETDGLLGADFFAKLMDGCVFVNTSRGSVIDQKAMAEAFRTRRLYGYLDVFEKEPLEADSPLLSLDNVLLTPHISGGHTINGGFERGRYIVEQLFLFHTTGRLKDESFKDMLGRMA